MVDLQREPQTPTADATLSDTVDEHEGLPSDWGLIALAELAEVAAGGGAPQGDEYFTGDKPFVRVQHVDQSSDYVTRWDLINAKAVSDYSLKLFPAGTIVLPKSGASIRLEKRGVLSVDSYLVSHLCAILPDEALVDCWYLFYVMRANKLAREKADGYPVLNLSEIKAFRVPLPPLPEQRAIAYVLRTVQQAREATEKVIAATRDLKKSLMRHLFTYGPVPVNQVDQVPLKETEIGPVPEHWKVVKLGEVAAIATGTTPSTQRADYYDGTIGFVRTSEIVNNRIEEPSVYISEQAVHDYGLKVYQPGVVFMAMYGQGKTRGQVALLSCAAATSQNTAAISAKPDLDSIYLWLYLMSQYARLRGSGIQGHISHLNLGYVKQLVIPMPPLPEQRGIVAALVATTAKEGAEEKRRQALNSLFNTMLHNLVTGKVRVQDLGVPASTGVM